MMILEEEFKWLIEQTKPRSVLEIGSYSGGSLTAFADNWVELIRAIDNGQHTEALPILQQTVKDLKELEVDIELLIADSQDITSADWAQRWTPYDLVFIDGDHSYAGVKQDYHLYAPLGKNIAFHDINGVEPGVERFWSEIKNNTETKQICLSQEGIGLIC